MKFTGKALVITIPLESNDLEEGDFDIFLRETEAADSPHPSCIQIQVGRSISEEESEIVRLFEIGAERFEAKVVNVSLNNDDIQVFSTEKVSISLGG